MFRRLRELHARYTAWDRQLSWPARALHYVVIVAAVSIPLQLLIGRDAGWGTLIGAWAGGMAVAWYGRGDRSARPDWPWPSKNPDDYR